jgi:hypothetical protein
MPEFTESERYLLLTALWDYRQTMTQLQAEHTEEEALPVAMQRLDELSGVVDKARRRPRPSNVRRAGPRHGVVADRSTFGVVTLGWVVRCQ